MRLLIVNFAMDPQAQVLGWQERVAALLAARCESVVVVTQHSVPVPRPANLHVVTMPRWPQRFPFRRLGAKWLLNVVVWRLCREYDFDACFVHMAHEWSYRFYPCFRYFGIPVLLWYAHARVTWRLELAHRCVDRVVTSVPEAFRVPSSKVTLIGQGVDSDRFQPGSKPRDAQEMVAVSRLSPLKRIHLLLEAFHLLRQRQPGMRLTLIGGAAKRRDRAYINDLRSQVRALGLESAVTFAGPQPAEGVADANRRAALHVNLSPTGAVDKTVLEALSCGCPVLTTNASFEDMLGPYAEMLSTDDRAEVLADRMARLLDRHNHYSPAALRDLVVGKHDVHSYVAKVHQQLLELTSATTPRSPGPSATRPAPRVVAR